VSVRRRGSSSTAGALAVMRTSFMHIAYQVW
jgi:hypothetical protein